MPGSTSRLPVEQRWAQPWAGERYANRRWRDRRRAARDPRMVTRLLRRQGQPGDGAVLDVPCGTGRLRETLEPASSSWVGVDVSQPMLVEAGRQGCRPILRADLRALPFADGSFDTVVACRILHHLHPARELLVAVTELVRVSSRLVIASFWDAGSLPGRRRRASHLPSGDSVGRVAYSREEMRRLFARAGAQVVDFEHSLRFLSQQTFLAARVDAPRPELQGVGIP